MANYYNINRPIEAYEFRTIDPNDGQLKHILDISGAGNEVDLSNYYTKPETDGLLTPYYTSSQVDTLLGNHYTSSQVDTLLGNHYTEAEANALLNNKLNVNNPTFTGFISGRIYDTDGNTELIIRRNGSSMINIGTDNIIYHYSDTDTDGQSIIRDRLKTNIFDSYNNTTDINFRHNDVNYLIYDVDYETNGGVIVGNIPLVLGTKLDIPLNTQLHFQHTDSYINETLNAGNFLNYVMREQTGQMDFYVGDPAVGTNKVMTIKNDIIEFKKPTNLALGGDTSNCVKYTGETLQTIDGAVVVGGGLQNGTDTFTVNGTAYVSGNAMVNGRLYITPNSYITNSGAPSGGRQTNFIVEGNYETSLFQVFLGNSNNLRLQIGWYDTYFRNNVQSEGAVKAVSYDTRFDDDCSFKRNGVEFMKFEKTLGQVEMTVGVKSNTYDSIGNADVAFRRNFVDFLYFRNNFVEVNNGVSLWSSIARINTINTAGVSDMVFQRNGVEYFRLDGANNLINVEASKALSSDYLYCNHLYQRTYGNDMVFSGSNVAGNAQTEYMRYRRTNEDLNILKDVYIIQDKRLYLHKETSKDSYVSSINIAGVNHTNFRNDDPNGDLRFFANGGIRLFITPSKVSVPAPYTLEGDLVDTSDMKKKYDIKSIEHNFTDIVKQVEPKTFKMNDEKEIGITKNHLGFIANEIEEAIPPEWENIVMTDNEGIKKLSYVKLTGILWGVCREQQNKLENLSATMYEMMEEIKELKGKKTPKPKPKAKAKN